ncbi:MULTISPECIES: ParC family partition-associated protein [Comamonadaceae]|jgi:hypothetical protein|uniref:ParC family partition-associated protein n=1 Tax=Comamonadaceae TaxID=80864 RepID=UPI00262FF5D8|nr:MULTISPECIES: ParC family partition-associated protein [Comamonadaceae]HQS01487.1 ParC family partition-associated protein [Polaromonas sp.]HQT19596.1 ParC family partition-associated protein [Acidovorax defluvii]HQT51752.1 ParC family partition-associated protein [Acidovorax defluvii]
MITDIDTMGVVGPTAFRELLAAGSVQGATIRVAGQGLIVVLHIGPNDRVLGQFRGGPRFFRSFDGAAAALRQNGVMQWDADATGWIPRTLLRGKKDD